jgi:hypothetical protein
MSRLFLVLALVTAGALWPVQAAEELPPDEAALCAHLQRQLDALEEKLDQHDGRSAQALRLIERNGALLKTMKEKLDQSDHEAVAAYNALVDQYGSTIARYNDELLPELARQRDAYNATARRFNATCAGRTMH